MTVVAFQTAQQNEPVDECRLCGGKNGKHDLSRVPYPWPFNVSVFKYIPCPMEGLSA